MRRVCELVGYLCFMAVLASCGSNQNQSSAPVGTKPKTDLEFAKTAFTVLANGDTAADSVLDWEHFNSGGINVGMKYNTMADDAAKAGFRKGFINSFSNAFKGTGARAESLTNWRVKSQDATQTVMAADTPAHKTLLITISKPGGQQKIAAIGVG